MHRAGPAFLSMVLLVGGARALPGSDDHFPVTTQSQPGDYTLRVSSSALDWSGQHIDQDRLDAYVQELTYRSAGSRLVVEFLPDASLARRRSVFALLERSGLCRQGRCAMAAGEPPRSTVLASLPKKGAIVRDIAYGATRTLTCRWFTNFENSRFEQCRGETGSPLLKEGGASVECLGQACTELDRRARDAAHWQKPEAPWGTFIVRLVGRVSLYQHRPHVIGDGTATVLVEKLLSVTRSD
jgi:hypothetical protein